MPITHAATTATIDLADWNADHVGESDQFISGRIAGRTYQTPYNMGFVGSGVITVDTLYAIPFFVGLSQSFDRIGLASLGVASSFVRVGLYGDTNSRPDTLLVDAGQVDTSTGGEKLATISVTTSGLIWIAAVGQGVAPSVTRYAASFAPWIGGPAGSLYSGGDGGMAYSQTGISGALPSSWGSTYTVVNATNTIPIIALRAA